MKSKIFCAMILIFSGDLLTAQEQNFKNISDDFPGYWNLSYSAGFGGNINTNGNVEAKGNGFSYSIDASYSPENNLGFFANYSSANPEGKFENEDYPEITNNKVNYSEFSIGPRLFSNDKNFFIDAGMGYYNITGKQSIGFNAGTGGKIKFSDSYGVIVNGRVHCPFVRKNPFLYYGIYLGFEMNSSSDKNAKPIEDRKENQFSVTVLGGKYSNKRSFNDNSALGAELSYDVSKNIALLLNYVHSSSSASQKTVYPNFTESYTLFSSENDITGGVRIYMTGNKLRLFVENYAGLYMSDRGYENSGIGDSVNYHNYESNPENYFGLSFGTGVDFNLINNLSGIFKVDVGTYFRESYFSTIFGGLKYSF